MISHAVRFRQRWQEEQEGAMTLDTFGCSPYLTAQLTQVPGGSYEIVPAQHINISYATAPSGSSELSLAHNDS